MSAVSESATRARRRATRFSLAALRSFSSDISSSKSVRRALDTLALCAAALSSSLLIAVHFVSALSSLSLRAMRLSVRSSLSCSARLAPLISVWPMPTDSRILSEILTRFSRLATLFSKSMSSAKRDVFLPARRRFRDSVICNYEKKISVYMSSNFTYLRYIQIWPL